MDPFGVLDRAGSGFSVVLAQVGAAQWADATGNEGQDVGALVDHVIGGDRMATVILAGGSREDGLAQFARSAGDADRLVAFEESRRELAEAFAVPGVLERTVHHPAMDMPGSLLLGFRISEYALHGWDLARAIGADDTIDPAVVQAVWEFTLPLADLMAASGMFGTGASGTVADDAPLQTRLLDLTGRRP
jgi:uncharacterized protein (TIGR03086 family)